MIRRESWYLEADERRLQSLNQRAMHTWDPHDIVAAIRAALREGALPDLPWDIVIRYPLEEFPTIHIAQQGRRLFGMEDKASGWQMNQESWDYRSDPEYDIGVLQLVRDLTEGEYNFQPSGERYKGLPVYIGSHYNLGVLSDDIADARFRKASRVEYLVALELTPQQERVLNRWLAEK